MKYCFGKGQIETAVSAPENTQPLGTEVLIKGSVLDLSPASAGTAAISDEDMTAWMEYLHMQKSMPMNAEGLTWF
jgi:hypothetical protein